MKHRFGQNVATDVESLKAASSPAEWSRSSVDGPEKVAWSV